MSNNIDYYIYKVHYSTAHNHKEHIEEVLTTESLYSQDNTKKKRDAVVKDIRENKKVVFSAPPSLGGLKMGAKVITDYVNGDYYIKTVADKTTRDNLDELPEY